MGLAPEHAVHPFAPVWDVHCRVLVLGSFPSVRSRQIGFYYGHPQNRFWRVLERLYGQPVPQDIAGRRSFVLRHGLALWDVLACAILMQPAACRSRRFPPPARPTPLGAWSVLRRHGV